MASLVKDQIKQQVQNKIKESIAAKQLAAQPPKKTVGGLLSNVATDVTNLAKGVAGMAYQGITHPIETTKNIAAGVGAVAKTAPDFAKTVVETYAHPIKTVKEGTAAYKQLRAIPYEEQKKFWSDVTEKALQEPDRGKRNALLFGSGMLGAVTQEATHPVEYAYEKPFSFALDVASAGKASGAGKAITAAAKGVEKVAAPIVAHLPPPIAQKAAQVAEVPTKIKSALTEVFVPHGKLVASGFEDVAKDMTKTKSDIFKTQRQIIDDTATKFHKDFSLSVPEQKEFFHTIDALRRDTSGALATSANPKIQKAIDWWLKEEAPAISKQAGLGEEGRITNYMHHFFPEKYKQSEARMGSALATPKRKYLEKSKDVAGFSDDPVLSISAIKSKVAIDAIKDDFIKNTVAKHGVNIDDIRNQMIVDRGAQYVDDLERSGRFTDTVKKMYDLEEYKPKGLVRVPSTTPGVPDTFMPPQAHLLPRALAEELTKFSGGGKNTVMEKMFLPFDVFNRNWKPLATAVRPRYHTRNVVGNLYNSIVIGGMDPRQIPLATIAQAQAHIGQSIKAGNMVGKVYSKIFGDQVPSPGIIKLAIDNDILGRGFFGADLNDIVKAVNNGDDIMKTIKQINTPAEVYRVPVLKEWLKLSQKVGEFLEDNARLAMFQEGMRRFKNVDMAKDYVNKHLFDYLTGLGEGDKLIRRFIPFWSWTRFNIPLQFESVVKAPIRHMALQKVGAPTVQASEAEDEGYQYLSDQEKRMGMMKVGETEKGGKKYDKYIRTAGVLPQQDLVKVINILKGHDEDIGFTALKQLYDFALKAPTEVKDYFGRPVEEFEGEEKKFLGIPMTGKTRALISTLFVGLNELDKGIGGSYAEGEAPKLEDRLETVISPLGVSLVDSEQKKYFKELEKEKELKGSYSAGLESIYRRNMIKFMKTKDKAAENNTKKLEEILKTKGLTSADLAKIKTRALRQVLKDEFKP